jgi:lipoate-protein ligase A
VIAGAGGAHPVEPGLPPRRLREQAGDWCLFDDQRLDGVQENVARDARLGHAVACGELPAVCRLWHNHQGLIVGRHDARLPAFQHAARTLAARGWPVALRETGGAAVPQGPGVLHLSLIMPRSRVEGCSTDAVYHLLGEPLQILLAGVGIVAGFGAVPGAFCDGRFNLQVAGRKIAGTAQAWRAGVCQRQGRRDGYVLAHAALAVAQDVPAAAAAVTDFYALAGRAQVCDPRAHTSVRDELLRAGVVEYGPDGLINLLRSRMMATVRACFSPVTEL